MMSSLLRQLTWRPILTVATSQRLSLVLRGVVASVFLIAAAGKMLDFQALLRSVTLLRWIPSEYVPPAAALLLVAELSTGLLLLTGRGVTAGALLGGCLAAAFMAVTTALMMRGSSSQCDCFGLFIKLPPWMMLGIDLGLFLACLTLLASTSGARAPASDRAVPGDFDVGATLRRLYGSRHRAMPFIVSLYLVTMAVGLVAGFERQQRGEAAQSRVLTLRYGDPAPDFRLRTDTGALVSPASLRGKWSLISFVQPGCEPCESELRDIGARYAAWKPQLNGLVILIGRPLFASAETAARRFARRLSLPMSVAGDPDRKVATQYCDRPLETPFSVLLDRHGIVRFIQAGRWQKGCNTSEKLSLVDNVEALLTDEPLVLTPVSANTILYGRRAPDVTLLVGSERVRLSSLWRRQPVLLTFVARDCAACPRQVAFLERAVGSSGSITPVYVYPNRSEAEAARALRERGVIAADSDGAVHAAYQAWSHNAPATFLIIHGRIVYAPGVRSNARELEQLLRAERRKDHDALHNISAAADGHRRGSHRAGAAHALLGKLGSGESLPFVPVELRVFYHVLDASTLQVQRVHL